MLKSVIIFFIELLIRILNLGKLTINVIARSVFYFYQTAGRPGLKFIFYKLVVKIYRLYLYITKKSGWSGSPAWSFLNQKMVHLLMVFISLAIVFFNITEPTSAVSQGAGSGQTILSSLIQNEFGTVEDERLIEEFFDQEVTISPIQQSYLENLSSFRSQPTLTEDDLNAEDELAVLNQGGTALQKPEMVSTDKIIRLRESAMTYAVEEGDTVSTIAQKFAVSVNTILWENDLTAYSIIRPGDKLNILPTSGISYKVARGDTLVNIANKYGVSQDEIAKANKLAGGTLQAGQKLIIPGGRRIEAVAYRQPSYSGISVLKDLGKIIKPGNSKPISGNKMNWPTAGYRITQYYSWRHTAVDIANKIGTPIYAADAGTIEFIGWGTGYGNQIVIDHGGGKKTRYAHLSKFFTKKGQQVSKGETIGAMGSTGWSTGSHLHFEIIINGTKYNPLNYIK
ncbi:MAG: peptidoglycan DD-metalloendopeptidase family protein [Patescibacteria group bacterium]